MAKDGCTLDAGCKTVDSTNKGLCKTCNDDYKFDTNSKKCLKGGSTDSNGNFKPDGTNAGSVETTVTTATAAVVTDDEASVITAVLATPPAPPTRRLMATESVAHYGAAGALLTTTNIKVKLLLRGFAKAVFDDSWETKMLAFAKDNGQSCTTIETCKLDYDGYTFNVFYEDSATTTKITKNGEDLVWCAQMNIGLEGEEKAKDQKYACTDSNNKVYELDYKYDFRNTQKFNGGSAAIGSPNLGWLNGKDNTGMASGFGNFKYWATKKDASPNTGVASAVWYYYMPTEGTENAKGVRWQKGAKIGIALCAQKAGANQDCAY